MRHSMSTRARIHLYVRTVKHLTMNTYQQCSSFECQYANPLVRVSFHNDVFIPQTINGTVFAAVLLRSLSAITVNETWITSNPWQGSTSNDCVYIDLASVPRDMSTRARVSLHARTVKHLTTNTYQQCSSSECQYVNPWQGSVSINSQISRNQVNA